MNGTMGEEKIDETIIERAYPQHGIEEYRMNDLGEYIKNPLTKNITKEEFLKDPREREYLENLPRERAEKLFEDVLEELRTGISDNILNRALKGKSAQIRGVYFEKQSYDVFTNPNTDVFLKKAGVDKAVVYGVATDYCVKAAVLGMQERGIQCYVVEDAIMGVGKETTEQAIKEMKEKGARFVMTRDVLDGLEGLIERR
jgi:hypothetical protein